MMHISYCHLSVKNNSEYKLCNVDRGPLHRGRTNLEILHHLDNRIKTFKLHLMYANLTISMRKFEAKTFILTKEKTLSASAD